MVYRTVLLSLGFHYAQLAWGLCRENCKKPGPLTSIAQTCSGAGAPASASSASLARVSSGVSQATGSHGYLDLLAIVLAQTTALLIALAHPTARCGSCLKRETHVATCQTPNPTIPTLQA
jgi:hypothetical protein